MNRVLVSNSGNHPEPAHFAIGLKRAGWQVRYYTSTMWAQDHALMRVASSGAVPRRFRATLLRRALPQDLTRTEVRSAARIDEVLAQVARRIDHRHGVPRDIARTRRFRQAVANRSARNEFDIIVAQYTSALEVFSSHPDTIKVLMYPIAHHRWMAKALAADSARNPRWSAFLQGHDMSPRHTQELDAEIASAHVVVVPSSFVKRTFVEEGIDESKIVVLNLGVDLVESDGIGDDEPRQDKRVDLLFVGQVNQRKGVGNLLEAVSVVGDARVRLSIIGDASPQMREVLSTEYPSVNYLGTMPRSEVKRHMGRADVLVLPSLAEGFALVGLEAMSMGTPVAVTASTGLDIIEDGVSGWYIGSSSTADIAATIEAIIERRDSLALVSESARILARQFSWDAYGTRAARLAGRLASRT